MLEESNVDKLLYLNKQKYMIEKTKESMSKLKQAVELQRKVITLSNEK